jgi:hypothetical protein
LRDATSMRSAIADLELDVLYVVHPGAHRFPLGGGIEAVLLSAMIPAAG